MKLGTLLIITACTWAFSSCNPDDDDVASPSCNTSCQNGGTVAANCTCNCPNGFYGANCQNQQIPVRFIVTSIKLTSWPTHPSTGGNWDGGNGRPDIYFRFYYSSTIVQAQTGYVLDCLPNSTYIYNNPGFPFLMECGRTYPIEILDEDGSFDQTMLNSYGIDIADFSSGLNTTIPLYSGAFAFQLNGYWQF